MAALTATATQITFRLSQQLPGTGYGGMEELDTGAEPSPLTCHQERPWGPSRKPRSPAEKKYWRFYIRFEPQEAAATADSPETGPMTARGLTAAIWASPLPSMARLTSAGHD